jgi:hypothetical protein
MMSSQMSHTIDDDDDLGMPENPFMSVTRPPIPPQQQHQQQQSTQVPSFEPQQQGEMMMNMNIPPKIPINDNSFQPTVNDAVELSGNMNGNTNNNADATTNNNNGLTLPVPSVFSFQTYSKYFNIDTVDVQNRITGSIAFVNTPDHFREQVLGGNDGKGPDLYGPIWVTLTLVFFVALTSNLARYIHSDGGGSGLSFEYDIRHLVNAMWVLFGFVFVVPVSNYVLFRCMGVSCFTMIELVCLYGYSMTAFFPASFMCLVPMAGWDWTVLLAATVLSALLILRNVAGPILQSQQTQQKAGPILIYIMVTHFIFYLVMKLMFYHHKHDKSYGDSSTSSPTMMPTIMDQSGDN